MNLHVQAFLCQIAGISDEDDVTDFRSIHFGAVDCEQTAIGTALILAADRFFVCLYNEVWIVSTLWVGSSRRLVYLFCVRIDDLVIAEHFYAGCFCETGFFVEFAHEGFINRLTLFDMPSGQFPSSVSLYEHQLVLIDNEACRGSRNGSFGQLRSDKKAPKGGFFPIARQNNL